MINAVNRRKRGLFEGLITFSNLVKKENGSQCATLWLVWIGTN